MKKHLKLIFEWMAYFIIAALLGWGGTRILVGAPPKTEIVEYRTLVAPSSHPVILYGTEHCPYCRKARDWLAKKQIAYEWRDISVSTQFQREFEAMKGQQVPLILVGVHRINGYFPEEMDKVIELALRKP